MLLLREEDQDAASALCVAASAQMVLLTAVALCPNDKTPRADTRRSLKRQGHQVSKASYWAPTVAQRGKCNGSGFCYTCAFGVDFRCLCVATFLFSQFCTMLSTVTACALRGACVWRCLLLPWVSEFILRCWGTSLSGPGYLFGDCLKEAPRTAS